MQRVYFTSWRSSWLLLACLLSLFCVPAAHAAPPMFVNRNHLDGLGSNYATSVSINDTGMYVGTTNGLSFSGNGGATFTNRLITSPEYIATNWVGDVTAVGEWIYVTTSAGLWLSFDGGQHFSPDTNMRSTYRLHADGTTLYVANISSGLGITDDSGLSVTYRTTANGLGSNTATAPFADGSNVYVGTQTGLSISTDGGATFVNRTTANGLGSNTVYDVYASGNRVYAATAAGLSISTDGGATFVNRTTANGLGNNKIWDVYAHGTTVYAATDGGLSISTDGGLSFINKTTADGLGANQVFMIAVHGTTLALATSGGISIGSVVNANADLSSLTTSSGTVTPAITPGTTSYTTDVANSVASLMITPTTADPAATLTVNGVPLTSGSPSSALPLSVGPNTITIEVTAADQATTQTYTMLVRRATAPMCVNRTTANGLASNLVSAVYANGSTVYAGTFQGLGISQDSGATFATTLFPAASDFIMDIYDNGPWLYVTTFNGNLWKSNNGGLSFAGAGISGFLNRVYATASTVYVGTENGLQISTDQTQTWSLRTTANGLGNNNVYATVVDGSTLYAATNGGLSISTDNGISFVNRTTANGLGSNQVYDVAVKNGVLYAATNNGLAISTDGGATFSNRTTANGLGNNTIWDIYTNDTTIYASTNGGGLSISTDGGTSFITKTTADGLGSNTIYGVSETNTTLYVATLNGLAVCTPLGTNADLSSLTTSSGTLSPAFAPGITSYTASVPHSTSSLAITPTVADLNATITVNGVAVASGSSLSAIPLSVGQNTILIRTVAQNLSASKLYTLTVTRAAPVNVNLSSLLLSAGALNPPLTPGITNYTVSVPHYVTSLTVTPSVADPIVRIGVNKVIVASGSPSNAIPLNVGQNFISIALIDLNLTAHQVYLITITRASAVSAPLSNLTISSGSLNPTFAPETTSYTADVDNSVTSMTVTPSVADPTATISVNGVPVTSGSPSPALPLSVGQNSIVIQVATPNQPSITYMLMVTRAASANADLSSLTISSGTLNPAFAPGITSYTASVPHSTSSLAITPTVADPNATITVNGVAVASGSSLSAIPLSVGQNSIIILVTAQDQTTKTYTLTVTRAASANADLSSLTISSGTLNPAFAPGITSYTASVPHSTSSLAITPTVADPNATITVNGVAVASGSSLSAIPLSVGQNSIIILVTAQDQTTKTYTLTVTRAASANADLSSLTISSGTLNPAFAPGTTSYTASVANNVTSMAVTPTVADPTATVSVNGVPVTSGSPSPALPLSVGQNSIIILVTAQDQTTKTYTLTVTRAASAPAWKISLPLVIR